MLRSPATLAMVLALANCGEVQGQPSSSVTIDLPPPRPADARPGFSALDEKVPARAAS